MDFTTPHYMARSTMRASMKDALSGKYSYTKERLPWVWQNFQREEEIGWVFKHFENLNLVRLVPEPDDLSFDDLHGECFDEQVNSDMNPNLLRKQRKEAEGRLEHEGQWRMVAGYMDGDHITWTDTDSIGGFVGDDFYGSGYEPQMYLAALEGLFESRGGKLPEYVPSKTGAWSKAVLMGWEMIKGNDDEE